MTKNLKQLREKAATKSSSVKLKELIPPADNTIATQRFIKKHVVAHHDDPAGNGDDVFKASNIKTVKRSPEHGYDPGQDEEVYESVYYEHKGNLVESSPPGKAAEKWITANKKRFINEYGQEKGMRVLYAKAWKMFGENAETDNNEPWSHEEEFSYAHTHAHDYLDSIRDALNKHENGVISGGHVGPEHVKFISRMIDRLDSVHNLLNLATPKTTSESRDNDYLEAKVARKKNIKHKTTSESRVMAVSKPKPTFGEKPLRSALKLDHSSLEARMAKMARNFEDQRQIDLLRRFRAYWGPDAMPKEDLDSRIYDIFDQLNEENKEIFVKILGEDSGLERISEVFGLGE